MTAAGGCRWWLLLVAAAGAGPVACSCSMVVGVPMTNGGIGH